jgi:hypothetical protein
MKLEVGIHLDIDDMIYYAFYNKLLIYVSQPVSKYNTSKLENFLSPVTILAASSCIFSILSESYSKHPSHNSHAYSKNGLIKVI